MWMFTKYGFFSIVQKGPKKAEQRPQRDQPLCIRARAVKDLTALKEAFPELLATAQIELSELNDYYARIHLDPAAGAELFAALAEDIDYPDFKSELKRTHVQDDKLPWLNRVWQDGNDYQHAQHPGKGLYNQHKKKPRGGRGWAPTLRIELDEDPGSFERQKGLF